MQIHNPCPNLSQPPQFSTAMGCRDELPAGSSIKEQYDCRECSSYCMEVVIGGVDVGESGRVPVLLGWLYG